MNKQGKVWGFTTEIFNKNNVEIHRLCGQKDCFCSKHKHEHKFNMFFVERGKLRINIWKEYGLTEVTELVAGEMSIVPPGLYHMFTILTNNTVVFEIYWVELDGKDIQRENVGGNKNE